MAQQPAQGSGMQVRPGGSRRPLVSHFRPTSCLYYISSLLCVRFLPFPSSLSISHRAAFSDAKTQVI